MFNDLRYGFRMLLKNPGFTAAAVLALALGIGGNTAIFSVVNAVLLRPLPYKDPATLVELKPTYRGKVGEGMQISYPDFLDWQLQNQSFEYLGAYQYAPPFNISIEDRPETAIGFSVSHGIFDALGVQPTLGRTFLPEEDQPDRKDVVVLSHDFWRRHFGGDVGVIGRNITIDHRSHTIVGVMPAGFNFPLALPKIFGSPQVELWVPLGVDPSKDENCRGCNRYLVIGRLRSGIDRQQAQEDMNLITRRLEEQYPASNKHVGVKLIPLHERVVGEVRPALWVLLGAVGFVLLVACANVANLLLARAAARHREVAIRQALGASQLRLIRQYLTESVLLALLGGLAGLLLATWGISTLIALGPQTIPRLADTKIDGWVLSFTGLLAILTGILFGLAPAVQASRLSLNETLKEGAAKATTGRRDRTVGNFLIVSEIALALVLSVGSGLLIKSFLRLLQVDPGFHTDRILTLNILLPQSKYPQPHQWPAFFSQVLERVAVLPGVQSAAVVNGIPLGGGASHPGFLIEGRRRPAPGEEVPNADHRVVSPNYFEVMGIPIVRGRAFTAYDTADAPAVAIINETTARRYWPNEDPIGKRLAFGYYQWRWCEIVGIVKDIKHYGLDRPSEAEMYFPQVQEPSPFMVLAVRAASDPKQLAAAVQNQIWAIDKDQPVSNIRTMDQLFSASLSERRFQMVLLGIFGTLALILAAVGIFGVMAYSVSRRTQEIGVRIALGAKSGDILKLMLGQGLKWSILGVAIGLILALALSRVLSSLLFQVKATDPAILAAVSLLLGGVALLACYIPARRATQVDPMVALRYE